MRKLTDHIVEGDSVNHQLDIQVLDEPGAGGANHQYMISFGEKIGKPTIAELEEILSMDKGPKPNMWPDGSVNLGHTCYLAFQNGPIKEAGVNGVTHEALLAVLIDRMRAFQSGPFSCRENAIALTHMEEGLMWLQNRTRARMQRGVEGTHEK